MKDFPVWTSISLNQVCFPFRSPFLANLVMKLNLPISRYVFFQSWNLPRTFVCNVSLRGIDTICVIATNGIMHLLEPKFLFDLFRKYLMYWTCTNSKRGLKIEISTYICENYIICLATYFLYGIYLILTTNNLNSSRSSVICFRFKIIKLELKNSKCSEFQKQSYQRWSKIAIPYKFCFNFR